MGWFFQDAAVQAPLGGGRAGGAGGDYAAANYQVAWGGDGGQALGGASRLGEVYYLKRMLLAYPHAGVCVHANIDTHDSAPGHGWLWLRGQMTVSWSRWLPVFTLFIYVSIVYTHSHMK